MKGEQSPRLTATEEAISQAYVEQAVEESRSAGEQRVLTTAGLSGGMELVDPHLGAAGRGMVGRQSDPDVVVPLMSARDRDPSIPFAVGAPFPGIMPPPHDFGTNLQDAP